MHFKRWQKKSTKEIIMTIKKNTRIIKRVVVVQFIVLAVFGCGKDETDEDLQPSKEKHSIKVMTYNIYGARPGGIPDLQDLADVINRAEPDLVALQEVDKFTKRNGEDIDVAKELGDLCGMEYFFARARDHQNGEYGDAVLSKLPIKETKAYNLDVDPELGGEQRSVARITVEVGGDDIYFISTHFDHLSDETNRIRQAKKFNSIIANYNKPLIVGADFNSKPESKTIKILKEQLVLGCKNSNCTENTFSTSNPNRVIDYILYKGIQNLSVSYYAPYSWADRESDHFPVLATFQYRPNE